MLRFHLLPRTAVSIWPEGQTAVVHFRCSRTMADSPFSAYQRELDAAFHSRDDPIPAGTLEHGEALVMLEKLVKLKVK